MLKYERHTFEFSSEDISSRGIDVEWVGELLLPLEDSFNVHSNCIYKRQSKYYQVYILHVFKGSIRTKTRPISNMDERS